MLEHTCLRERSALKNNHSALIEFRPHRIVTARSQLTLKRRLMKIAIDLAYQLGEICLLAEMSGYDRLPSVRSEPINQIGAAEPVELIAQSIVLRPVLPLQFRFALRLLNELSCRLRQLDLSLPQCLLH